MDEPWQNAGGLICMGCCVKDNTEIRDKPRPVP